MSEDPSLQASAVVRLPAQTNIQTIGEVHAWLTASLQDGDAVTVALDDVAEPDLTLIQLIESARATALQGGKQLRLSAPASGGLLTMLERGGFLTAASPEALNFWTLEPLQ